jgi:hypothetical protein
MTDRDARRSIKAGDYLIPWVREALRALGGKGTIVQVCEQIWRVHELDLRAMGDAFFTWQYDVRWAAYTLREAGEARVVKEDQRSVWQLTSPRAA